MYYAPTGGHPGQDQLLTDRAMFTEAYAVLPRGTMRDIVVSHLPHWELTRLWVLARPLSGFAETFSQYVVEVLPGGTTTFLSAFGFFASRLLFCSPLAIAQIPQIEVCIFRRRGPSRKRVTCATMPGSSGGRTVRFGEQSLGVIGGRHRGTITSVRTVRVASAGQRGRA